MARNDFARQLMDALTDYTDSISESLEVEKEKVAKEGVKRLKETSPKRRPKYAKSWRTKQEGKAYIIHNTHGQLSHLLEKGHALKKGGRSRKFVHIQPVEQQVITDFERAVERAIKR